MPVTLIIELPDDLAEQVRVAASEQGQDVNAFAVAAVAEAAQRRSAAPPSGSLADLLAGLIGVVDSTDGGRRPTSTRARDDNAFAEALARRRDQKTP